MDKLKENGFAIGVGAAAVGLLAFIYFWVVAPLLGELPAQADTLTTRISNLERYVKAQTLPTTEYHAYLEDRQQTLRGTLDEATSFYKEKQALFSEFFEGTSAQTQPGDFKARFTSAMATLREEYLKEFPRAEPVDPAPARGQPDPQRLEVQETDPLTTDQVVAAMKEYWIAEQIFTSLRKHGLGGLRAIEFPKANPKTDLPPAPTHDVIRVAVEVSLPLPKLAPFLADLFASRRVPFLDVLDLTASRPEASGTPQRFVEKEYVRHQDAEADRDAFIAAVAEPEVTAKLVLAVMDWKGLPVAAPPEADSKSKKKK